MANAEKIFQNLTLDYPDLDKKLREEIGKRRQKKGKMNRFSINFKFDKEFFTRYTLNETDDNYPWVSTQGAGLLKAAPAYF